MDILADIQNKIIYVNGEEFAGYYIPTLDWGKHGGRVCFNRWKKAIDMEFPISPNSFETVEEMVCWIKEEISAFNRWYENDPEY